MSGMTRSRSMLLELMIVILFLSIASCTLARLFASANEMRMESRRTQDALILAQDALERFAAGEALPETWEARMGERDYTLIAEVCAEMDGRLERCAVSVQADARDCLRLETARYAGGGIADAE